MHLEVESTFLGLFVFLTAVLLIARQQFQLAFAEAEHVVCRHLVVMNMLEGSLMLMLMLFFLLVLFYMACSVRMLAHDSRLQVIVREFQVAESPSFVQSQHSAERLLRELRVPDLVVDGVLVFARMLLAPSPVPNKSLLVAGKVNRVVP